jgi:iron complex outermembrane receptor protein
MTAKLRSDLLGSVFFAGAVFAFAMPAHAATSSDSAAVSEVVVTAEKRTEKLQDVPAAISVVGGMQLEQMRSTQLMDWAGYVPGLAVNNVGAPGETTLALDGIAPIGSASEVGVYINDTPVGSSSSFQGGNGFSLDLMPYDLDRVEVLHGPQGTLYGASTMGGLVKYVLAAPNLTQFSGRVGGDLFGVQNGNTAGGALRGAVNLPLVEDKLALRVSLYDQSTPGFIDDATTGKKADNALNQGGGRMALLWKPSADVSVQLSGLYQRSHADNQSFVALDPITQAPIAGRLSNINTLSEPYTQDLQLYDLNINWDLHWATLTSVTSYQDFHNNTTEDLTDYVGVYLADFGAAAPGLSDFDERYRLQKVSQEVRLASPTGQRFEWLLGAFYTHETGSNYEVFNAYDDTHARLAGFNPLEFVNLPSTYQEYAVFGQGTFHFTDRFDVNAGLRYAHNDQTFTESEGGFLVNPADPSGVALAVPGKSSEGVTTFSVGPRFHLTKDTLLYARIASGYQPGGPNVVLPGADAPAQFHSSQLTDYQVGLKSSFLDGKASVDLSVFYIDWTRIQVSVLTGAGSAIENAGAARSEGVDLAGAWSPIPGLNLGGSVAYTDAYLTSDVASLGVLKGAQLPSTPMWSGSLTADYNWSLTGTWRGFIGGGFRYVGDSYSAVEGELTNGEPDGIRAKAYGVVDLHLGTRNAAWTVTLFAKNLGDTRTYLAPSDYFYDALGLPIDIKAPILQPRTIGISIDRSF